MSADTTTERTGSPRILRYLRRSWAPIVLVAASLAMSITVTGFHTQAMSPIDEWVYIDYLYKLPDQGIVRQGDEIGPEALELMACSGEKAGNPMGAPCSVSQVGDDVDPALFPYAGLQSAYGYTPLYFAPTWAVAKVIQGVTGADLLTAARFTGPLWLAGTMLLFFALFREFKVNRVATVAIGLAFIGSPFAWWTYTYISTDIPSVGISAIMLLAARRFITGRWSGWWVVLLAVAAVLFKTSNILAVGLVALYLLAHFLTVELRSRPWRAADAARALLRGRGALALPAVAVLSLIASGVTQYAWLLVQRQVAVGPPADQANGGALSPEALLAQLTNFLPNTILSNVDLSNGLHAYPVPDAVFAPLSWLCIAGVVGSLLVLPRRSPHLPLAYSVGIASVLCAPLLAVLLQLTLGQYFVIPERYGASILIGFLLMAGIIARDNPFVKWVLTGYGAALVLFVIVTAHGYAR